MYLHTQQDLADGLFDDSLATEKGKPEHPDYSTKHLNTKVSYWWQHCKRSETKNKTQRAHAKLALWATKPTTLGVKAKVPTPITNTLTSSEVGYS